MGLGPKLSIAGTAPRPDLTISRHRLLYALLGFALTVTGSTSVLLAQETPQPQAGNSSDQSAPSKIPPVALYNLLEKKSIVFPDIASSTERLSTGQKFELFVDNSLSVHTLTWAAVGSSFAQAENSPTGRGQGWDGYTKRFGSSMARQASSNFFGTFLLASALHQDPRFYPEIRPSLGHAMKYSGERVFVTRNDDGRDVVNWSGLAAPLLAEGLANVYWPEQNRSVGDTFLRYGLDLATRAGGNMLREYWPVFYRKIRPGTRTTAGHN
jgi:hypothetical protein